MSLHLCTCSKPTDVCLGLAAVPTSSRCLTPGLYPSLWWPAWSFEAGVFVARAVSIGWGRRLKISLWAAVCQMDYFGQRRRQQDQGGASARVQLGGHRSEPVGTRKDRTDTRLFLPFCNDLWVRVANLSQFACDFLGFSSGRLHPRKLLHSGHTGKLGPYLSPTSAPLIFGAYCIWAAQN